MTRWQKFGWALGYSALFVLTPLAYLFLDHNALMVLPGTSVFAGVLYAAFSEIPALEKATTLFVLAMLAGLVISPVCAAFRRYLPLYGLMALDVALHALLIAHGLLEADSLMTLYWLIPGTLVSIALLAATAWLFRHPGAARERAARDGLSRTAEEVRV